MQHLNALNNHVDELLANNVDDIAEGLMKKLNSAVDVIAPCQKVQIKKISQKYQRGKGKGIIQRR